jgi:deoxyadenosine/deoxycytidine kinase
MPLVVVTGLIGAGKTTVAGRLAEGLGGAALDEPTLDSPQLARFYADMAAGRLAETHSAATLQFRLLEFRLGQYLDAVQPQLAAGGTVVLARSIEEDLAFARVLRDGGALTEDERAVHAGLLRMVTRLIPRPDLVVRVATPPATCLARIRLRGRRMEASIDLAYLERLDAAYAVLEGEMPGVPQLLVDNSGALPDARALAAQARAVCPGV